MELVSYTNSQQSNKLPPITNLPGQISKKDESIGGKYTLANNSIAHPVPPRNALRSNIDHQTGIIDSWPAHSTNQRPANMQLSLDKNYNLIITDSQAEGKPELTPKPRFLENLEKFLQRELKALGCDNTVGANESRLQAYREVFEYLLEEFKTYRPLLSSIKNEYEMMLAAQREKIRELEPLKQMLVTLADQCDHKLMQYREEERIEIKKLKEEKKKLMDLVLELKNEKQSLHIQVDKLQNELSNEHERFRNEQDKRKLLIVDLNDLRFQQEEAKMAELKREKKRNADGLQNEDDSQEDPVTLKIALRVCRQNLNDAMKRLTKMEADYGDVIPRRDFLALENSHTELNEKHEILTKEHSKMKQDFITLKEYSKNLETKYQECLSELENSRGNVTPRPDWEKCSLVIEPEKWKELINNKTSAQILDSLLNELSGYSKQYSIISEYFAGVGVSNEYPPHLRFEGKVKNLNLTKIDIFNVINDVWKEREKTQNKHSEMSVFLIGYLKKRYGSEQTAFEYSYALNDAIEKYPNDEYIQQFAGIVNGQWDEEIYYHEENKIKQFFEYLKEAAREQDSNDGTVSKHDFKEILKTMFKFNRSQDHLDVIIKAAEDELGHSNSSSKIDFKLLFSQEIKDKNDAFLNALRKSFKEERLLIAQKICENLGDKSHVNVPDLKKSITQIDDSINEKELERIARWCLNSQKQIDMETFTTRVENCCFQFQK